MGNDFATLCHIMCHLLKNGRQDDGPVFSTVISLLFFLREHRSVSVSRQFISI